MKIKNRIVPVVVLLIVLLTVAVPVYAEAEEVRISSIDDSYIGKEVTVSGVIVTIASNIEPSKDVGVGIQTYEPGDTGILTIDDGTATILVSTDPRLLEKFYKGQCVMVAGIYAGKGGIADGKGIIYAYAVNTDVSLDYEDVTVKELKDFPQYYHAGSVRIQGDVTRIEFTSGETKLEIDDHTGTIEVVYGAVMENIRIGDEVIVKGEFSSITKKIYAFEVVGAQMPEPEVTPEPSPSPSPSPTTTPAPTATPAPAPAPTPSPMTEEEEGMPIYLIAIIIAVVAVVGVVVSFKLRELLMLRRYGK